MRIYVASSWRNARQPNIVSALRAAGHDVYDFRNPKPGNIGFSWRQCSTLDQLRDPQRFRDEVLTSEIAREGFDLDMTALRNADVTVLVLPCGRSAHLEFGWAAGHGQQTFVLFDDVIDEPELMYLMNTQLCVSLGELIEHLEKLRG